MMKHFVFLSFGLSMTCAASLAQPFEQWVGIYNGSGADLGRAMVIDHSGHSYIAGTSDGTGTGRDCAVVKYDSLGNEVWVARFNGPDSLDDWAYALAVDDIGNVYVTGQSNTATAGSDYVTIKYDAQGNEQWVNFYDGTASASDVSVDIALDQAGNVFVTGKSEGVASMEDYVTIKYDNAGNQLWVKRYNGTGNNTDDARSLFVDPLGNVYVSGGSIGDTTGYDFVTIKYDNAGNEKWIARYNGPGNSYDLVFYQGSVMADSLFNVYVVGYSTGTDSLYEYALVKYDSSGNQLWDARYAGDRMGKDDFTDAVTVDRALNVYITGAMYDSISDYDFTTIKYDLNGNFKWKATYNGTDNGWDEAYGIVVDDTGNVYVGGRSNKANFSGADFVILKYDSSGNELWNVSYSRGGFSWPFKLRMDQQGNLFIGGWSSTGTPNTADFTVVKYGWTPLGIQAFDADLTGMAYPNPFTKTTTLLYSLPRYAPIEISIYNLIGQTVFSKKMLQQEGQHAFIWHATDIWGNPLPAGMYHFKIRMKEAVLSQGKLMLVR